MPYRQNWCARGLAAERWQDENVFFWQENPTRSEGYRATKSYLKSSEFAAAFVQVQLNPPIGTAG